MSSILGHIDSLGRFFTSNFLYTYQVLLMGYLSVRATVHDKAVNFRQVVSVVSTQIYFTGWQALPLISVLALGVGGVVVLQSLSNLSVLGGIQMIGNVMIVMVVREAGPLLVALVVVARSGTAVASEVGNMRANREIEALESLGINPLSFIVFPRILGGVLSVLGLAFYFNLVAILGGFLVTRFVHEMPLAFYADSIFAALTRVDIFIFLVKNAFSGLIIFLVSCYQGFSVKRSPHEVPQVTTQAVMNSIIFVVFFNLLITAWYYFSQLRNIGVI